MISNWMTASDSSDQDNNNNDNSKSTSIHKKAASHDDADNDDDGHVENYQRGFCWYQLFYLPALLAVLPA